MITALMRRLIRQVKGARGDAVGELHEAWLRVRSPSGKGTCRQDIRRILVMPADPWSLVGSLGDGAMLAALVDRMGGDIEFDVVTATEAASQNAAGLSFHPHRMPDGAGFADWLSRLLDTRQHDTVVALGADVLDGYYDPLVSARMLVAADIAARKGLRSVILGFSFNAEPAAALKPFFDDLDPAVVVNVRDAVSLERLRRFSGVNARLVADAAFSLRPLACPGDAERWVAARRAEGCRVLALNLHPMLARAGDAERLAAVSGAAAAVSASRDVAWMLVPHDYRPAIGDAACLAPLGARLAAMLGERVLYLDGEHLPGAIKALAGRMDGVVTARMHLAIAALGSGVPALSMAYQGKFDGLYRHFALPDDLLLRPEVIGDNDALAARLLDFVDRLAPLTQQVRGRLETVQALSLRNFETLRPPRDEASP